jgi:hypothetical protein
MSKNIRRFSDTLSLYPQGKWESDYVVCCWRFCVSMTRLRSLNNWPGYQPEKSSYTLISRSHIALVPQVVSLFQVSTRNTSKLCSLYCISFFLMPRQPKYIPFFALPCGAKAQIGPRPPPFLEVSGSHSDTLHSVGLLWTGDQPVAETSTWQCTTRKRGNIDAPGGIRIHGPSKGSAVGPSLRPRGHWKCLPLLYRILTYTHLCVKWPRSSSVPSRHTTLH